MSRNIYRLTKFVGHCEQPACPAAYPPAVADVRIRGAYLSDEERREVCQRCLQAHIDHERQLGAAIVRAVRFGAEVTATAEAEADRTDRYRQTCALIRELAGWPHCIPIEMGIAEAVARIVVPWDGQRYGSDDPEEIERATAAYGLITARAHLLL
jgi:hypothetical protein